VTISIAVVISGLVALTLTPALCVIVLKPLEPPTRGLLRVVQPLLRFGHASLHVGVSWMIRRAIVGVVLFLGMVAITTWLWRTTPGSLVPDEDQGFYISA
jgi:HAE1 family hydrophobic/amphiphilic exporter-1/multidrug efflux pump